MNYDKYYYNIITKAHIYTLNGVYHRVDGPAIKYDTDEFEEHWFFEGKKHREDGPASIYTDYHGMHMDYWFHGFKVNSEKKLQQLVKLKVFL